MFKSNIELYKMALYLTLSHLESKLSIFKGSYFTLHNGVKCKCVLLKGKNKRINFKYETLLKKSDYYLDDISYYIFVKAKCNDPYFIYDYEFSIIHTNEIKYLISPFIKHYLQRKTYITGSSYYVFDEKILKSKSKIMKL